MATTHDGPVRHSAPALAKTPSVSGRRPWRTDGVQPALEFESSATTVGGPTPDGRRPDTDAAVVEAVRTAIEGLQILEQHAREAALAFRTDHVTEGRDRLASLVETTQTMLRLAVATAETSGRDLDELCRKNNLSVDSDTRAAVDRMIECQLAGDWPELASVLDGQFSSVLRQWQEVFQRLGSIGKPDPGGRTA
jgi:hypothetical protein